MFSLVIDNFSKIFLAINLVCFVFGSEDLKDDNIDRGSRSGREGGMWWGPRLGKRSQAQGDDRQTFLRLLEAADALKYYYDQLQYSSYYDEDEPRESKKVIFTPKLGRSVSSANKRYESVDFTPRLGRRIADRPATPPDREVYRPDPVQIDTRTKYFSPRLGRTMDFSPRLGRELSFEVFPDKIRVVRSTNDTKST